MGKLFSTYGVRLFLILFLHAIAFYIAWNWGNPFMPDSYDYLIQAEHIREENSVYARDHSLSYDLDYISRRPPLYALFIAAIQYFSPSVFYVLLAQYFLSAISLFFLLIACQGIWNIPVSNRRFFFVWLFLPLQLLFAGKIMSELLFQVSLTFSVLFLLLWYQRQKAAYFFLSQLCLIAAVFTKPAMSLYWPVTLILALIFFYRFRRKYILLYSLLFPLAIASWSYNNYLKTGYYHFSSISHVNLVDYNLKYFLQHKHGEDSTDKILQQIYTTAEGKKSYAERCVYLKDTATDIIGHDITGYSAFHFRGTLPFFLDGGRFEYATFFNADQSEGFLKIFSSKPSEIPSLLLKQDMKVLVFFAITALGALLLLFYLFRFLFLRRYAFWEKAMVLLPVFYLAAVTGPLGSARFRFPILLLMIMMFLVNGKEARK